MFGEAGAFLTNVLSARGPDAVAYAEQYKWTIRDHVSELLKTFPSLVTKTERYSSPDGRTLNLLKADGTVPMHYQGVKYNIPVLIVLPEKYPVQPPAVYVVPTANMLIQPNHSYVDYQTGLVSTPCLKQWLHPSSTLLDAVTEMSIWFGSDPPLYARTDNAHPTPRPPVDGYQQTFHNPMQQGSSSYHSSPQLSPQSSYIPQPSSSYPHISTENQSAALSANTGASGSHSLYGNPYGVSPYGSSVQQPPPGQGPPPHGLASQMAQVNLGPYGQPAQPPPGPTPEQQRAELEKIFKDVAKKAIVARLSAVATGYYQKVRQELERLAEAKRKLLAHSQELQKGIQGVQDERLAVEALVKDLATKADQMNRWLQENEWKAPEAGNAGMEFDRVIQPADAAARAQLQSQAEDMALEDAIDVLNRAHQDAKISTELYLKQVRVLARRQFYARAISMKASRRPPPAPAPPPPVAGPPVPTPGPGPLPHMHTPAPAGFIPPSYHYPPMPAGPPYAQGGQPPPPGFNTGMLTNPLAGR